MAFAPGRTDASQAQTDVASFGPLEPSADGFRNYYTRGEGGAPAEALVGQGGHAELDGAGDDRAARRPAGARRQCRQVRPRRRTARPGTLTPDFFVNLLDMSTKWTRF